MPQSMGEIEYEHQPKNNERLQKKKEKKWTLGSLFRRKKVKESDSDSSDSDAIEDSKKGGFLARRRRRRNANRGSKDVSQSFEHVILRPNAGGNIPLDGKRLLKARVEASRDSLLKDSSSEDERSPQTKPRAPRSKRSSRDMTDCNMKVMELDSSPRSPRWTAKVVYCESSDYDARYTAHTRSATPSPAQSPIAKVKHLKRPPIPQSSAPRPLHCQKSASFDILPRQSQHFHLPPQHHNHYHHPQLLHSRIPPPPPPRDPQRKIIPPLGYQLDRPLSYAFESNQPLTKVMMDHNSNVTPYKVNSSCSLDHQPVYKMNSSGSLDHKKTYQYYTDQQPRSRRPIHITRIDQPYLSDSQVGRIRTNEWRLPRDSISSLCDSSDSKECVTDIRPLSMVAETSEQQSQQQELTDKKETKRKSGNLEDALNELEAIYKSLQLRDEEPPSRGFESDSGYYRAVDDMAYRRLNRRESGGSPDCRRVMSQAGSYLLVSPTLSPPPFANAPTVSIPQNEPDITLDDVVYRNIRHTNNTLKVADPQPPFGIPIGPITPAPNSDYLHATPKQLFRPSFKPRKTPDIVKDDLAYRNLRKDGQNDSLLTAEDCILNDNPSVLKKKRAVRSLSANLLSIIQKEHLRIENQNEKIFNYDTDSLEKTQSYSDLPDVVHTRYKRSYSTEGSDTTPRVSQLYSDLPISTTSTETLTDSRANIINAQDSCSTRNQYLPLPSKPLPKTDFAKLRLPSPSPHQTSPKKFLQNVDSSTSSQQNFEKDKLQINERFNKSSSPHNLLKIDKSLADRNNSESPCFYYSASESPSFNDSKNVVSAYKLNDAFVNNKKNMTLDTSAEINYGHNGSSSPSRRGYYDSLQQKANYDKSSSEWNNNYCNGEYGKFSFLNTSSIENRRCVSQSPRIDDNQEVKNLNPQNNFKSSLYPDNFQTRSLERTMKNNSEVKSSIFQPRDNKNFDLAPESKSVEEDSATELSPVPLNPPKISIRPKGSNEFPLNKSSFLKSTSIHGHSTTSNNSVTPKVTENKISIEGIKLFIPSESKCLVQYESDETADNFTQNRGKICNNPPSTSSRQVVSVNSQENKERIPSPQTSICHEKSHQSTNTNSNSGTSKHFKGFKDIKNNNRISEETNIPLSPSTINKNSLEKNKSVTSRPKTSTTSGADNTNAKVPSSTFFLNMEKNIFDDKVKSNSSSPRLSVESNASRLPSPQPSVTSVISPTNETNRKILLSDDILKPHCTTFEAGSNMMQKFSHKPYEDGNTDIDQKVNSKPSKRNDNSISSCSDNVTKNVTSELKSSVNIVLNDEESSKKTTMDSDSKDLVNNKDNSSSHLLSFSSKETSPLYNKLVSVGNTNDVSKIKTSGSGFKIEKDIDQLLSEINDKQGEILSGKNKQVAVSETSLCNDKKENLTLGKVTPHRPVKLTTFAINDNNTIENNETIILPNRENEIIGTSESMTDLLRELTRSLDQDFGCLDTKENVNQSIPPAEEESDIERMMNKSLEEEKIHDNSKSSDSQELNITDEADNEVMEINRIALEQNMIKEKKRKDDNGNLTGFVAVKGKNSQAVGNKDNDADNKLKNQSQIQELGDHKIETKELLEETQSYYSDDSNAEFVEAICKTASELSTLSSTSNVTSPSLFSSQRKGTDETSNSLSTVTDRKRWSQQPQSRGNNLDQNEGTSSSEMDCSPLIHPSVLIMFCTFCIARLHQLVDLDFLTVLGLLIAVISLILLLVL